MILTREWLNEYIDLSDISSNKLVCTLNNLGLEVEAVEEKRVVDNVVVGYVKECKKHPNADKLNITKVDIGHEVLQIICGAKNVKEGIFVAVSKIGAILPNGLEIKKDKHRDEDSFGMICASNELGFESINEGIMILDDSIGELVIGKELHQYPIFNDTFIEIDITPNRGDCLSILGVARDLSCSFSKTLKIPNIDMDIDSTDILMYKVLKLDVAQNVTVNLKYKIMKFQEKSNVYIDLLYSYVNTDKNINYIDKILGYISHTNGVILNAYCIPSLDEDKILELEVMLDDNHINILKLKDKNLISKIGVKNSKNNYKINTYVLIEASYQHPIELCKNVSKGKVKCDSDIYFKSSRGSNPDISYGLDFLSSIINNYKLDIDIVGGYVQNNIEKKQKVIVCSSDDINSILGSDIDIAIMSDILTSLYFVVDIDFNYSSLIIKIPFFRHDILNIQDISEEILRITGIDNIKLKPLQIYQQRNKSKSFEKYIFNKNIKNSAINNGFFENISFVFTSKEIQSDLGFDVVNKSLDIVNPITQDLNTLRSSILPNLLQSVKLNKNNNFSSINLFEIGSIFDKHRKERQSISFISSGFLENANITNHSKAKVIDFYTFVDKLKSIFVNIRLEPISKKIQNKLIHPYQSASIFIDDKEIGFVSKLHSQIQKDMKIYDTFIASLDIDSIFELNVQKTYKHISKYPVVYRDLSLVASVGMSYSKIRANIESLKILELKSFYPVDIFNIDDKDVSISIRFELQSEEKTLEEEDINNIVMKDIYKKLLSSLKLKLRE
jgi:phenylalanyl-tRNA synthetase beta chain